MIRRYEGLGRGAAWMVAVLAPLAASAAMIPLRSRTDASNLALVMIGVVAASVVPGVRSAAVAGGLSAGLWFDFLLTRPYETFSIERPADIRTAILMTIVASVVGTVAARRRQAGERARLSNEEVVGLYVTAQMLSGGARPEVVLETISEQLQALLGLSECRFDAGRPGEHDPMINRAGDLEWRDHRWSLRFRGWPPEPVSLPVDSAGRPVGRFLLHGSGARGHVTLDRLMTALALADLAGAALAVPAAPGLLSVPGSSDRNPAPPNPRLPTLTGRPRGTECRPVG